MIPVVPVVGPQPLPGPGQVSPAGGSGAASGQERRHGQSVRALAAAAATTAWSPCRGADWQRYPPPVYWSPSPASATLSADMRAAG